jgi:ApaG protein
MTENDVFPYEMETWGVTVRVFPEYMDEDSSPAERHFIWRYTIQIENGVDDTIQLLRRHWEITDAAGRRQIVDGDGVVGEKPVLEPGGRYIYVSGCPLNEPSGMMSGTFSMRRDDGLEFDVTIPAFSLDSPYETAHRN